MRKEPTVGDAFAYNVKTGNFIAAWSKYDREDPPSAYEVWDHLGAAFPLVVVLPGGTLWDMYPKPAFKPAIRIMPNGLVCPKCGITEQHPREAGKICIRGYKVQDSRGNWSQCLVCSGLYDNAVDLNEDESMHNPEKGWFL